MSSWIKTLDGNFINLDHCVKTDFVASGNKYLVTVQGLDGTVHQLKGFWVSKEEAQEVARKITLGVDPDAL